jgi:hypothetical protein
MTPTHVVPAWVFVVQLLRQQRKTLLQRLAPGVLEKVKRSPRLVLIRAFVANLHGGTRKVSFPEVEKGLGFLMS